MHLLSAVATCDKPDVILSLYGSGPVSRVYATPADVYKTDAKLCLRALKQHIAVTECN